MEKCCECDKEAIWFRMTQFAGTHPFCQVHAMMEKDFDAGMGEYSKWVGVDDGSTDS